MNEAQKEEMLALEAILESSVFSKSSDGNGGTIHATPHIQDPLTVAVKYQASSSKDHPKSISHLSALHLIFEFPPEYPKEEPPKFSITCQWLERDKCESLERKVLELWKQSHLEAIIFEWYNFLCEEALSFLGIQGHLQLDNKHQLQEVLRYDQSKKNAKFQHSYHCCMICFDDLKGDAFAKSDECDHHFCRSCLKRHVETKIKDGQMNNVDCPDPDCHVKIHGSVVRNLVDDKLFETYDNMLLNLAIRSMSSTVWCPRKGCEQPAQTDKANGMGMCPVCQFTFCIQCEENFHPGKFTHDKLIKFGID